MRTRDLEEGMEVKLVKIIHGDMRWTVVSTKLENRKVRVERQGPATGGISAPISTLVRPQDIDMPWDEWERLEAQREAEYEARRRETDKADCEHARLMVEARLWVKRYEAQKRWEFIDHWGDGVPSWGHNPGTYDQLMFSPYDLRKLLSAEDAPPWPTLPECPNGHPWTPKCHPERWRPDGGAECAGDRYPDDIDPERAGKWRIDPLTLEGAVLWREAAGVPLPTLDDMMRDRRALQVEYDLMFKALKATADLRGTIPVRDANRVYDETLADWQAVADRIGRITDAINETMVRNAEASRAAPVESPQPAPDGDGTAQE